MLKPNPPSLFPPQIVSHFTLLNLIDSAKELRLQYELPLFVLLALLICLVVLPPHRLLALPAGNVPYHMTTGGHIAFVGFSFFDVDDLVEEVGFAMLAAEVLKERRGVS